MSPRRRRGGRAATPTDRRQPRARRGRGRERETPFRSARLQSGAGWALTWVRTALGSSTGTRGAKRPPPPEVGTFEGQVRGCEGTSRGVDGASRPPGPPGRPTARPGRSAGARGRSAGERGRSGGRARCGGRARARAASRVSLRGAAACGDPPTVADREGECGARWGGGCPSVRHGCGRRRLQAHVGSRRSGVFTTVSGAGCEIDIPMPWHPSLPPRRRCGGRRLLRRRAVDGAGGARRARRARAQPAATGRSPGHAPGALRVESCKKRRSCAAHQLSFALPQRLHFSCRGHAGTCPDHGITVALQPFHCVGVRLLEESCCPPLENRCLSPALSSAMAELLLPLLSLRVNDLQTGTQPVVIDLTESDDDGPAERARRRVRHRPDRKRRRRARGKARAPGRHRPDQKRRRRDSG